MLHVTHGGDALVYLGPYRKCSNQPEDKQASGFHWHTTITQVPILQCFPKWEPETWSFCHVKERYCVVLQSVITVTVIVHSQTQRISKDFPSLRFQTRFLEILLLCWWDYPAPVSSSLLQKQERPSQNSRRCSNNPPQLHLSFISITISS